MESEGLNMAKRMRELGERLGVVNANPTPDTPQLRVPSPDKTRNLADEAVRGFAAVTELHAERNRAVILAQTMHQETVFLRNVNVALRAQLHAAQAKAEYFMKLNARLGAWVCQANDITARMKAEITQMGEVIDQMPPPEDVTNNPNMPQLDANGLPVEHKFDENGMPLNGSGAKSVSAEELQQLIGKLGQAEAGATHASNAA